MQAILLAAGIGRRLVSMKETAPKCLLEFDGESLLLRHVRQLDQLGITRTQIVVGHLAHMIKRELEQFQGSMSIETIENGAYRKGSIISLLTGLKGADTGVKNLVMDADVLYHAEVLRRLVQSEHDSAFLLDERSEPMGEEMMLGAAGGRVMTITRNVGSDWDVIGEGVGFFMVNGPDIPTLRGTIERMLSEGLDDSDYESAIDRFLKDCPAYYETVSDLPWTEIDFDVDVEHAQKVVLPAIKAYNSVKATSAPL